MSQIDSGNAPKEKLQFFSLNKLRSRRFDLCEYCKSIQTKGRDILGFPICEKCFSRLLGRDQS